MTSVDLQVKEHVGQACSVVEITTKDNRDIEAIVIVYENRKGQLIYKVSSIRS